MYYFKKFESKHEKRTLKNRKNKQFYCNNINKNLLSQLTLFEYLSARRRIKLHNKKEKRQFSINKMKTSLALSLFVFCTLYGFIHGAHFRGGIISW